MFVVYTRNRPSSFAPTLGLHDIEQTGANLTFEGCGFENSCAIHESGFQLRLKIK